MSSIIGVVQQQKTDGYYLSNKHITLPITKRYCAKDHPNHYLDKSYWRSGFINSGSESFYLKAECNYIDPDICIISPDVPLNQIKHLGWENPVEGFTPALSQDGQVKCKWDLAQFENTNAVYNYSIGLTKGGRKGITNNKIIKPPLPEDKNADRIYNTYCNQIATVKPPEIVTPIGDKGSNLSPPDQIQKLRSDDPLIDFDLECPIDTFGDGEMMSQCSYFSATSKSKTGINPADLCNEWLKNGNKSAGQESLKTYCDTNKTRDCLCINPEIDPEFEGQWESIPPNLRTSRGCWYPPCQSSGSYLITTEIQDNQKICDSDTVCDIINNWSRNKNVNVKNLKQDLKCTTNNTGVSPTPSSDTLFGIRIEYIIIGVVILIIIIIGIIYAFSGKKKEKSTD